MRRWSKKPTSPRRKAAEIISRAKRELLTLAMWVVAGTEVNWAGVDWKN